MAIFAVRYDYLPNSESQKNEHRPSHRAWLSEQFDLGNLLASGPFIGVDGALLIWQSSDADSLRTLLQNDPFAEQKLIENTDITEWNNVFGPWSA